MEISATTLDNGLPLVRLSMPGTRALTALVAFDAGARTERSEENGMSHFLEHLVFKGTATRSTSDIAKVIDILGGDVDAFTGK